MWCGERCDAGGRGCSTAMWLNPSGATAGAYQPRRHRVAGADGVPGDRQPRGRYGGCGTIGNGSE